MEMSKISLTSICSSKNFFRLASARHIRENKEGEGGMGREAGRGVSPQTQKPNSAYRNGQINFHYNPIKNAPKCTIFIFKIQKFFPAPHTPRRLDSRAFGARWDPQKKSWVRVWDGGEGEVGQGTDDEGGEGRAPHLLA
jgi:hypothetical protein